MISELTGECVCLSSDELLAMVMVMTGAKGQRSLPVVGWNAHAFERKITQLVGHHVPDWAGVFDPDLENPFHDLDCFIEACELVASEMGAETNKMMSAIRRDANGTLNTWIDGADRHPFYLCMRMAKRNIKARFDRLRAESSQSSPGNILHLARFS